MCQIAPVSNSCNTDEAHEALCRRCGVSCHFAVPVNGLPVVVEDLHCRYLDRDTAGFRCRVYPERFDKAPWCATVDEALEHGLLAQDCLYTANTPGYRGKTRLHQRLMKKVLPAIRAHLLQQGAPVGACETGLRRFLERTGGGHFEIEADATGVSLKIRALPSDD